MGILRIGLAPDTPWHCASWTRRVLQKNREGDRQDTGRGANQPGAGLAGEGQGGEPRWISQLPPSQDGPSSVHGLQAVAEMHLMAGLCDAKAPAPWVYRGHWGVRLHQLQVKVGDHEQNQELHFTKG